MTGTQTPERLHEPELPHLAPSREVQLVTPLTVVWAVIAMISILAGLSLTQVHPAIPVGVMWGLCSLVLLYRYPVLGVLAYLVFEYARLPAMFPFLQPLNLGKVIVVATAVMWLVRMVITKKHHFVRDRVTLLMGVWVALAFWSCLDALEPSLALTGSVGLAKFVGSYYLIVNLVRDMAAWNWFVWVLLLLHIKLSQFQLRMYVAGMQDAVDRYRYIGGGMGAGAGGFFGNSTDFGAAMCVVVPFAYYLFTKAKSKALRAVAFVACGMFVVSILRSGSRGAAVSLFAMAGVWWLKNPRKLVSAFLLVVFAGGFWVAAPAEWQKRFKSAAQYEEDATASHRLRFWSAGLHIMITHPLDGVGVDNFTAAYRAMGGDKFVAHSIWIEAAAELGVVGLALVLGVVWLGFHRNRQTRALTPGDDHESRYIRGMSDALDLSLVGYIVAGTFTSILYYPFLFMTLAMIVSLHNIASERAGTIPPLPASAARPRPA